MKTHQLAKALTQLAAILESRPDGELETFRNALLGAGKREPPTDIAVNLTTLVNLSRIGKAKWLEFIEDNRLPLRIRPRDASRDVLGKLLRYLEDNDEARQRIRERIMKRTTSASPELTKALELILGDSGAAPSR